MLEECTMHGCYFKDVWLLQSDLIGYVLWDCVNAIIHMNSHLYLRGLFGFSDKHLVISIDGD